MFGASVREERKVGGIAPVSDRDPRARYYYRPPGPREPGTVRPRIPVRRKPKPRKPGRVNPRRVPGKPLFPKGVKPRVPFGRFVPAGVGGTVVNGNLLRRYGGTLLRRTPWGAVIAAGGLYWAWKNSAPFYDFSALGMVKCCDIGGIKNVIRDRNWTGSGCPAPAASCGLNLQVYDGVVGEYAWPSYSSTDGRIIYIGERGGPGDTRMTYREIWVRPDPGSTPIVYPELKPQVKPLPVALPDIHLPVLPFFEPVPWVPEPLLIPAPIMPGSGPKPVAPPPNPVADAPPQVGVVPSLDIDGNADNPPVTPGEHYLEPPGPNERERKKRLSPSSSRQWMKALANHAMKITEFDDFITAIYRALPWQIRRWRGRDGVWRERHHTTALRAEFLWLHLGAVNITKAIENIAWNEIQDAAIGKAAAAGRAAAQKLGLNSATYSQMGGMSKADWEVRKANERAQFQAWRNAHPEARYYYKNVQLANGSWVRQRFERPTTQIPWFRKQSRIQGYGQQNSLKRVPVLDKAGRIIGWNYQQREYYAA